LTHPSFDQTFQAQLWSLFAMRRDTRHFRHDLVEPSLVDRVLSAALQAPSVGLSEPWRYVLVESPDLRQAICQEFEASNQTAAEGYVGEERREYEALKLAGLRVAPIHLAIFESIEDNQGRGLGRQTMPETIRYSTICSIQNLWLACTAVGLGMGWVSILRTERVKDILKVPELWDFVAYFCIGWPQQQSFVPELETVGWETRRGESNIERR
jgi:5,6-dimethylbenzimidazole synthase